MLKRMACLLAVVAAATASNAAAASPVGFSRIVARIEPGTEWMTVKAGAFCEDSTTLTWDASKSEIEPSNYASLFRKVVSNAGFSVEGSEDALFDEVQPKGEFVVGAVIVGLNGSVCYGKGFAAEDAGSGRLEMAVEWQIYSRLDRKVVAAIPTRAEARQDQAKRGVAQQLPLSAFRINTEQLVASPEFTRVFSAPARSSVDALQPAAHPAIRLKSSRTPRTLQKSVESVALVLTGDGFGSAFLVSNDGYLITNEHVVAGAKFVKLRWSNGTETLGEVVRSDRRRDVALLKADPAGREALPLGSNSPQVGDSVTAIGAPIQTEFQGTVTKGIVSSPLRTYEGLDYLQSDVTVNPGNSGGPLLDGKGAVVAITDIGIRPGGVPTNINLFIPISDALSFLRLER